LNELLASGQAQLAYPRVPLAGGPTKWTREATPQPVPRWSTTIRRWRSSSGSPATVPPVPARTVRAAASPTRPDPPRDATAHPEGRAHPPPSGFEAEGEREPQDGRETGTCPGQSSSRSSCCDRS